MMASTLALLSTAGTMGTAGAQETDVDINGQCSTQYPGSLTAEPATAILTAPGDAYSWRCEQRSKLPGGGLISNLPVDANTYCVTHNFGYAVPLDPQDPGSWRCRL